MKTKHLYILLICSAFSFSPCYAQGTAVRYTTTETSVWQKEKVKMASKAAAQPVLELEGNEEGVPLKAWGTTFNELDWDALQMLTAAEQEQVMERLFSPQGDLRLGRGRIGMNANDYARSWFSCDEVSGDFELRYFNIERDKQTIIPLIRAAQKYNPQLTFWISPWSPPSWMKINHDYPVVSSKYNQQDPQKDCLLFGNTEGIDEDEMKFLGEQRGKFPRQLATQDYMIQDSRYLQAYANYFCRFIEEYAGQGIPIDMVIYQNEAYSYTPYPGCAWTAEGTVRFNRDFLAPTLKKRHPDVQLYLGTFNTNRQDHVERILSDDTLRQRIQGLAFQWEGRQILPDIRKQYPDYHYICSESECGNGSMDWSAGEHTFFLISDNMGQGCDEWFNWNFILSDNGESPWGWRQNALIQVKSETCEFRYTPEFYAVKHFTHFVEPGSQMVGYYPLDDKRVQCVVWRAPQGGHVVVAGCGAESPQSITLRIGGKYLNATLPSHSFSTFVLPR